MAMRRLRYTVDYERDAASGTWTAVIDRSQGVSCVTQGRSLAEARRRIREALALFLDNERLAEDAELIDKPRLAREVRDALARAKRERRRAEAALAAATEASDKAARLLTTTSGLSLRDASELLGVSAQSVHARLQRAARSEGTGRKRAAKLQRQKAS